MSLKIFLSHKYVRLFGTTCTVYIGISKGSNCYYLVKKMFPDFILTHLNGELIGQNGVLLVAVDGIHHHILSQSSNCYFQCINMF